MEEMLSIIWPSVSVAETTMGPMPLGRMCLAIIFMELQPKHRAASTYSCPRSVSTAERTTRAKRGIWLIASEIMRFTSPFAQGGENWPWPEDGRYGHEHVDESHEQGVRPPAEIARRAAYDAACDEGYGYRRYAAEERDAPAVEDAREQIPPQLVRAEGCSAQGERSLLKTSWCIMSE